MPLCFMVLGPVLIRMRGWISVVVAHIFFTLELLWICAAPVNRLADGQLKTELVGHSRAL